MRRMILLGSVLTLAGCSDPVRVEPVEDEIVLDGAGSWSVAAPLAASIGFDAVYHRGQVYVVGGFASADGRGVYRLDPNGGSWTRVADLPRGRGDMPVVVLGDTLFGIGGGNFATGGARATFWSYDADADAWTERANGLLKPLAAHSAVVADGKIIVVGGIHNPGHNPDDETIRWADSVQIYDGATGTWRFGAPGPPRRRHAVMRVIDGTVYMVSGRTEGGSGVLALNTYDPVLDEWSDLPYDPQVQTAGAAVLDGRLHVFGGHPPADPFHALNSHNVYDPVQGKWLRYSPMPQPRRDLVALAAGGRLMVIGGLTDRPAITDTVYVYEP